MEDGLLSLKWNNHRSTFFHILASLRKKHTFTDATLACEGKFYPVHKLVMSTCSDYFSDMFDKTPCKYPVVVLKDIKTSDLEALLDYMYLGEVDVKQSDLTSLIKAAECLRIRGLAVPDEDPGKSAKKSSSVPDRQASPPPKRHRRESGGGGIHHSNGRSSPTYSHHSSRSSSSSSKSPQVSVNAVPSQLNSLSECHSQVPSRGLDGQSSGSSKRLSPCLQSQDSDVVPIEMIKVEVDDDEGNTKPFISTDSEPLDQGGGTSGDGLEGLDAGQDTVEGTEDDDVNSNYNSYPSGELDKEDQDQLEYSTDQMAGPSGMQGGQPMNWGEEDSSYSQNLFSGDDQSHQQVWSGKPRILEGNEEPALPLSCRYCGREYNYRSTLKRHLRAHFNDKKFHCPLCSYRAVQRSDVTRHIRIHTGERPYACPHCDHRATQSSDLDRHIVCMHPDLCLSCSLCSYMAPSKTTLRFHERKKHTSS